MEAGFLKSDRNFFKKAASPLPRPPYWVNQKCKHSPRGMPGKLNGENWDGALLKTGAAKLSHIRTLPNFFKNRQGQVKNLVTYLYILVILLLFLSLVVVSVCFKYGVMFSTS